MTSTNLRRRTGAVACACLLLGLAQPAAAQSGADASDPATSAEVEAALLEMPVYGVIKQYYPETYAKMRASIEQGIRSGRPILAMQADVRGHFGQLFAAEAQKADPANLVDMIDLVADQAESVAAEPAACLAVIGLVPYEKPADEVLPPELLQRELDFGARLLRQTATAPYRPNDPPLGEEAKTGIFIAAYDALPSDDSRKRLVALNGEFAGAKDPADQRVVCEFTIAMFRAILRHPPARAAELFRSLSADGG